jgi:hypothetical protein
LKYCKLSFVIPLSLSFIVSLDDSSLYRASEASTIPEPVSSSGGAGGASFGRASGQGGFSNNGKWSSNSRGVAASAVYPRPSAQVPVGAIGFQSARSALGQHNYGVFNQSTPLLPPVSSSSSSAFKPFRPTSSSASSSKPFIPPKYLAPRDQPNGIPSFPPISSLRKGKGKQEEKEGPPEIVETRSSMIREAVLVNPKLEKPKFHPSTQRDLLSSFQKVEKDLMNELKGLGGGGGTNNVTDKRSEIDLTISSDDVEQQQSPGGGGGGIKRPPMSPQRPLTKKFKK